MLNAAPQAPKPDQGQRDFFLHTKCGGVTSMGYDIETYFRNRVDELRSLAQRGDPWVFLCASSFLEYLAKIELGKTTSATDYKDFLKNYLFKVCPAYAGFQYHSGSQDLADQMYHVLRCGIVHSFSLFADPAAKRKHGGRDRSILLAHRSSGQRHLANYV